MTASVTFHIGDFKTGTTAVQNWLAGGAAPGLYAPPIDADALAHAVAAGQGCAPMRQLGDHLRARMAAGAGGWHAVISSEHFEAVAPAALARLIAAHLAPLGLRLRLLAYLRPHAGSLLARYGESIKIGSFQGGLDAYLDWKPTFWRLRGAPRFGAWRAAFGPAFGLQVYDRARFPGGDIRRALCQTLTGVDPGPLPPVPGNPALDLAGLRRMRALHALPALAHLPDQARWRIGRRIGGALARADATAKGPGLVLHRALAARLHHGYLDDARQTDAAFFDGPLLQGALARAAQRSDLPEHPVLDDLAPPEPADIAWAEGQLARALGGLAC